MNLEKLLKIGGKLQWRQADKTQLVTSISTDSRDLSEDQVFVALRGSTFDGHNFLKLAADKKPLALVVEEIENIPYSYEGAVFEVLDTAVALHKLSRRLYGKPSQALKSLAITGTNGKSSFCYIYEHMKKSIGVSCGVIGTINHHLGDKVWPTEHTTPPAHLLQQRLGDFVDLGAESYVIEVSSHALHQSRIQEKFDLCVFTNFSRDHMDYHKTEEDYFQSKALLFGESFFQKGVDSLGLVNGDDSAALRIPILSTRECFTFGKGKNHDFGFEILEQSLSGTQLRVFFPKNQTVDFFSPLVGEYNAYNAVAALASIYLLNFNWRKAASHLKHFTGIPGRLERVPNNRGLNLFVDFAHSEDSLRRVLSTLKALGKTNDNKLVLVFGCGGDRDRGKRRFMGKVAQDLADYTVVTSDNPRFEDPETIIGEILEDFIQTEATIFIEKDRKRAIEKGLSACEKGDIFLVCGKGHEKFQIFEDKKIPFDDVVVIREALISNV